VTASARSFDAVVIGAGSAGLTVAVGLAGFGKRVALIEAHHIGGDCTNVGCVPSKALLHAARVDTPQPLAHVRAIRDGLRDRETAEFEHHDNIELLRGRATLTTPGQCTVTNDVDPPFRLEAPHIVIATGSTPTVPEVEGLPAELLLTNEQLFEIDAVPNRLVILGGGAIAVEMATAFGRLGGSITIIEAADRILPAETPEASDIVANALRDRGVVVSTAVTATRFVEDGATLELSDGTTIAGVDAVLAAIGRRPRTGGLGLDTLGIELDRGRIVIDSWGRTTVAGVWAVGDVTNRSATTHGANAYGRRTVRAIALPHLPKISGPPHIPAAVFSDPEVASVGYPPDVIERRWPAGARRRIRVDLSDTDRGLTDEIRCGAVIVDVERFTGRLLRATIVGPAASEAIGTFTLAFDRRVSMHRLFTMVHPYPTFASAIGKVADEFTRTTLRNPLRELAAWLRHLPHIITRRTR